MKKIIAILFFPLCFAWSGQAQGNETSLRDTVLNMSDDELKELEQKMESEDPTFRLEFVVEKDVSFFLAAQKRRPQNFIWIWGIQAHFASERYNARQMENENEKKALFENALLYLTESLTTLENVTLTDVDDTVKFEYNLYMEMLKEDIAFAAVGAGELTLAKRMANELLINNVDTMSFNYGNIIHNANTILGQVALRENDLTRAKAYLIKSAETPGGPGLNTFGPSYVLAKELLKGGEEEIVLEYLDLIAKFWIQPSDRRKTFKTERLQKWKEEIESGKIPNDPGW